jgi:hypothetical protein
MYKILVTWATVFLLSACTKDRVDELINHSGSGEVKIEPGIITINEILTTGSPDWVELYNTSNKKIALTGGMWFVTDDLGNLQKFQIQDTSIKANDYLLIPCDGTGTQGKSLNTNFSLSSGGEQFGLLYKVGSVSVVVDSVSFPALSSNTTYGRIPNGTGKFRIITTPTPGNSNE